MNKKIHLWLDADVYERVAAIAKKAKVKKDVVIQVFIASSLVAKKQKRRRKIARID